jgi:hypothetical protein
MWTSLILGLGLVIGCGDDSPTQDKVSNPTPAPTPKIDAGPALKPADAVLSDRLSKDNGFRNATMGRDRSEFEDLQRRKSWDDDALGLRAYAKKKEYLLVGAATMDRIVYRFLDNKLYSVEILSEDLVHCATFREVLKEMYGPGRKSETGFDQLAWWGEDVNLIFTSMLDCSAEYTWRSKHWEVVVGALPTVGSEPKAEENPEEGSKTE